MCYKHDFDLMFQKSATEKKIVCKHFKKHNGFSYALFL